jgi:hypothetical protein
MTSIDLTPYDHDSSGEREWKLELTDDTTRIAPNYVGLAMIRQVSIDETIFIQIGATAVTVSPDNAEKIASRLLVLAEFIRKVRGNR